MQAPHGTGIDPVSALELATKAYVDAQVVAAASSMQSAYDGGPAWNISAAPMAATLTSATVTNPALTIGESAVARTAPLVTITRDAAAVATTAHALSVTNAGGGSSLNIAHTGAAAAINITTGSTSIPALTVDAAGGQVLVATGTLSLPGIASFADSNTGVFWDGINQLYLVTGGTHSFYIDNFQSVRMGTGNAIYADASAGIASTSDTNTGVNWPAVGEISIKTGGIQATRWNASQQQLSRYGLVATPTYSFAAAQTMGIYAVSAIQLGTAVSGTLSFLVESGRTLQSAGSAGAPNGMLSDDNTGYYWSGADEFAVSTNSTQAVKWDAAQTQINTGRIEAIQGTSASDMSIKLGPVAGNGLSTHAAYGTGMGIYGMGTLSAYATYNQFRVGVGTAATPSFNCWSYTTSGLYWPGSSAIAITTAGVQAVRWDSGQDQYNAGDIYVPVAGKYKFAGNSAAIYQSGSFVYHLNQDGVTAMALTSTGGGGGVRFSSGSSSAPSITFLSDPLSGISRKAGGGFVLSATAKLVATVTQASTVWTPAAQTSGSPVACTLTGAAHTTLAADTEASDVYYNLARTVQFTSGGGAFSLQRAFRITAPTYAATVAETITKAVTLSISGAPVSGTNMTLTTAYALEVESGNVHFAGDLIVDGSITGGGALSMDDTYNNGSAIVVDTAAVSWTVSGAINGHTIAHSSSADAVNIALSSSLVNQALVVTENDAIRTTAMVELLRELSATGNVLDIKHNNAGASIEKQIGIRLYSGYTAGSGARPSPSIVWEGLVDNVTTDSDTVTRMAARLDHWWATEVPAYPSSALRFYSDFNGADTWTSECLRIHTAGSGVAFPNGSVAAPSVGFFADDDLTGVNGGITSGFYSIAADTIGVSINGTERVRFGATEALLYNGQAGQNGYNALADAATIATNCSLGNLHSVTITANRTMGAPTNAKAGFIYTWKVVNGTTWTLAWNTIFKWPGGITPTLTPIASAVDIFSGVYDGTSFHMGSPSQDEK